MLNGALPGLYVEEGWMKSYGSPAETVPVQNGICSDHTDEDDDENDRPLSSFVQKTPTKSASNTPSKTPKKTPTSTPLKKARTPKKTDIKDLRYLQGFFR